MKNKLCVCESTETRANVRCVSPGTDIQNKADQMMAFTAKTLLQMSTTTAVIVL